MTRWNAAALTVALGAAITAGFFLGRLSVANAAATHDVGIAGLARQVEIVPTTSPTPMPTATPIPPTATATTQPVVTGWPTHRALTEPEMDSLLAAVGFPAWTWPTAKTIARCESNWRPWATGAAGERGIWQIHPAYHHDATYDVLGNARAAYRISNGGTDWGAWSCKP